MNRHSPLSTSTKNANVKGIPHTNIREISYNE